jgi:glycosyltransferase involved in cell wall biosynthesis/peptidoglycan/xylan/chitin deacetylase (PgdA/CDA1 family)
VAVNVSIVVPAYDAERTLPETIASIEGQSHPGWEAVVVDDGSTDGTKAVAEASARKDGRIRVVTQSNGGEGAARNAGIAAARFEWLLFLDADDRIAPTYLQRMTDAVLAQPELDAVHCGWIMVDPSGRVLGEAACRDTGDLFPVFANRNAIPIHACIVRRVLVEGAGRFDPSLRTCADWDLWQRVARLGARFGRIPDVLAHYCLRPYATWTSDRRFFFDGCRIIEQGYAPDPRVVAPHPSHASGLPTERLPSERLYFACFCAGLEVARAGEARALLEVLAEDRDPDLDPYRVSAELFNSAPLPGCHSPGEWAGLWPGLQAGIDDFLSAIEAQSLAQGLAPRTRAILERRILQSASTPWPLGVGGTLGVVVDITEPMGDVHASPGVARLLCDVRAGDEHMGTLELPMCDGLVRGHVLADAIVAAEWAWPLLGRFFAATIYERVRAVPGEMGVSLWRGGICLADLLSEEESRFPAKLHDRIGWTVFLQELWGRPDWELSRFYDPAAREEKAGTLRVSGNVATIEVATELNDIEASGEWLDVEFLLGGIAVAFLTLPVSGGRVRAQQLRAALTRELGFELCRAAVREGLVGAPLAGPLTLRERLAQAAKVNGRTDEPPLAHPPPREALSPSWARAVRRSLPQGERGLVLGRHAGAGSIPSVSRRAFLPVASAPDLLEAAEVSGQPVIEVAGRGPRRICYAPDLLWRSCHGPAIKGPAVRNARGGLSSAIVRLLRGAGNTRKEEKRESPRHVTRRLPLLMYHQVAPSGPEYLSRYRVSPENFEQHLGHLRDEGFRTTSLEEWWRAMQSRKPIPGRAVLLTFDDGFLDFRTHAWPLLKRFGFSAIVFLVAERVGLSNDWDGARGEGVPLLGWKDIHQLQDEGVAFGSHSATHPYLTALSAAQVVSEAARSRTILERELRRPVRAFAYPHGAEDQRIQHLIGACGYVFGLSCRPGLSQFDDPLLALPRIEVTDSDGIEDFVCKLRDGSTPGGSAADRV